MSTPAPARDATRRWLDDPVECGPQAGFGLYLHVPFCAHRCGYCDFATYGTDALGDDADALQRRYVKALRGEIRRWSERGPLPEVTSVFVGGGTPTLLPGEDLAGIIDLVRATFEVADDAEVTVEANPETADDDAFGALAAAGVNRMSLGAQSFAQHVLDTLERQHRPDRVASAVETAREAGIDNVSLDLIYGTPGESDADWDESVRRVLQIGVDHVSAYALTVAANTPLARHVTQGRLPAPDPDVQRRRFDHAREVLGAAGFEHYEISNWARGARGAVSPPATPSATRRAPRAREPGTRRSRHNVLYWRHGDYLGIGVGAHSHLSGERWWSHRSLERWLDEVAAGRDPVSGRERLSTRERAEERLMLGLRLAEGLHPYDAPPLVDASLEELALAGLLTLSCGRVQASEDGWFLLDEILTRLEIDLPAPT